MATNYRNTLRDIRSNMEKEITTIVMERFNGEFDSADPKIDAETCTIYVENDWGGGQDIVEIDRIA